MCRIEIKNIDRGPYTEKNVHIIANNTKDALLALKKSKDKGSYILQHTFFTGFLLDEELLTIENCIADEITNIFDEKNIPLPGVILQKPALGKFSYECLMITPKDKDVSVEYKKANGVTYALVNDGELKWIYAVGLKGDTKINDITTQSQEALVKMKTVLDAEGLSFSKVLRQWNYVPGIVNVSSKGRQHYQEFNDVRAEFYENNDFPNGYPAATGIGTIGGRVTINFIALETGVRKDVIIRKIKNSFQIDPHVYSDEKLVGNTTKEHEEKKTPKFERGKLVIIPRGNKWDGRMYISGTASIRGEDDVSINKTDKQTKVTLSNIENLISGENIMIENGLKAETTRLNATATLDDIIYLRTYIKNIKDASTIDNAIGSKFKFHNLVEADICRPGLLVEIEGEAVLHVKKQGSTI